ncbi:MAG: hypothetical protein DRR08_33865 [Candidatus Parabeggiatoa sp. nov. 2]|nr:MAG: hypothetical protein B6247_27790 [Beggiatoa sp. 4572_84]RKZ45805.1 MAG: hypothetical protein DRR08_33865 [Gammaproteobacteria bacterium]
MQENITSFDINQHHIHIDMIVTNPFSIVYNVAGILDTGAPRTEFDDNFFVHTGFLETQSEKVSFKPGLQIQKYGKIILPSVTIWHHKRDFFEVFVSHFEPSWGIDALVGLDFFRRFRVTIDYSNGILLTTPIGTFGENS